MALILRNGGSQSPDRWLKEPRNNHEDSKLFEKLKEAAITASNAREIKHLVKDTFSLLAIRKICSDAEE